MNIIGQIDPGAFATRPRMHHMPYGPSLEFPSSAGSRARGLLALKACNWGAVKTSAPTARDYVQDGLLFNWDAIENCGYGLHEEKPSAWVDLAGSGLNIPLSKRTDAWSFTDEFISEKLLTSLYKQHPQVTVLDGTVSTTTEWVERIEPGYTLYSMSRPLSLNGDGTRRNDSAGGFSNHVKAGGNKMWRIGVSSAWNGSIWVNIGENFNSGARFHYSCTIDIGEDGETCTCVQYVNGVEVKREVKSGMSMLCANDQYVYLGDKYARPCSIRYYTRALTSAEVAANYAVDKARFGLT